MKPVFRLRNSRASAHHQGWLGREVVDRSGRPIGRVVRIPTPAPDHGRPAGGGPAVASQASHVAVKVGTHWRSRFFGKRVFIPVANVSDEYGLLRSTEDLDVLLAPTR